MSGEIPVVDVDLSRFSQGPGPGKYRDAIVGLAPFCWFFVLLGVGAAGAINLAIALFGLSILAIVVFIVVAAAQRMRRSIVGSRVPTIRPEHETERLAPFDRTLREIAAAVASETSTVATVHPAVPASARLESALYILAGVLLLVAGLGALFAMRIGGGILAVCAALLTIGMFALFTRGRRALQPSASAVVAADHRAPILFLRSFRDDKTKVSMRTTIAGLKSWAPVRLEEALGQTVGRFGPFLAIGEPHEGLPQLGAARAYLDADQWQKAVTDWIKASRLIVMLAGPTTWIDWEVRNVIQTQRLDRLLLILPPGRLAAGRKALAERQVRWDNIVHSLQDTAFGPALKTIDISDLLLVRFRPDGALLAFRSKSDVMQDYDLALMLAIYDARLDRPAGA